jgi:hypothetical protein
MRSDRERLLDALDAIHSVEEKNVLGIPKVGTIQRELPFAPAERRHAAATGSTGVI